MMLIHHRGERIPLTENGQAPEDDADDLPYKGMVIDDSQPVSLSELTTLTTQPTQPDSKKS